jgi:hypothetical protein
MERAEPKGQGTMGIGISIFLIAVGAILYFAVSATVSGLSIATVGVVLMVVGALGLLTSFVVLSSASRGTRDTVVRDEVLR